MAKKKNKKTRNSSGVYACMCVGSVGEKEEEQRWVCGKSEGASTAGLRAYISSFHGSGVLAMPLFNLILL